jgi:hypothetical protein
VVPSRHGPWDRLVLKTSAGPDVVRPLPAVSDIAAEQEPTADATAVHQARGVRPPALRNEHELLPHPSMRTRANLACIGRGCGRDASVCHAGAMVAVCLEFGVGAHVDDAAVAWVYDHRWWGLCGQGTDERSAIADLAGRAADAYRGFLARHHLAAPTLDALEVVERVHGDERSFERDRQPATDRELERTLTILDAARADLSALLAACSETELDWDDPERRLPAWARWRTLRQMAWHIADTESRYYLAALDIDPPERADDLDVELRRSHRHVMMTLPTLPRDRRVERGDEQWTTRKLLRRLAWHEPAELEAMRQLRERARTALSG